MNNQEREYVINNTNVFFGLWEKFSQLISVDGYNWGIHYTWEILHEMNKITGQILVTLKSLKSEL